MEIRREATELSQLAFLLLLFQAGAAALAAVGAAVFAVALHAQGAAALQTGLLALGIAVLAVGVARLRRWARLAAALYEALALLGFGLRTAVPVQTPVTLVEALVGLVLPAAVIVLLLAAEARSE